MSENPPHPKAFEEQLKDCLSHLYDTAWLQNHELVAQIVPNATGMARVQAFRRLIIETVAALQPELTATQSREGRIYSILQYHYIEDQPHHSLIRQLNLSESQYYREHRRALHTIALLIWDRQLKGASDRTATTELTLQSESERLYAQTDYDQQNLGEVLNKVIALAQASPDTTDVTIQAKDIPNLDLHNINIPILQQLLTWLVYQFATYQETPEMPDGQLVITATTVDNILTLAFAMNPCSSETAKKFQSALAAHETLAQLLGMLDARLEPLTSEQGGSQVKLQIPLLLRQVLIIDDNPDALELLERLLLPVYQVITARQSTEGIRLAQKFQPAFIILDVMLPNIDGWHVLLNLKGDEMTAHIPVLICSVLETPDMAKSMGADWYLKKPPTADDLRAALQALHL